MDDLTPLLSDWPVDRAAAGVTDADRTRGVGGDPDWQLRIASVSKLLSAYAVLVALEEETLDLDEPAGPEGSTVRHLLAHASGLAFDSHEQLIGPGRRRIYSNSGFEQLCDHLAERAGMPFAEYLEAGVLDPLGLTATELRGSPAYEIWSTVSDLVVFGRELLRPTLIHPDTLADATRPHFPDLRGALPGVGRFDPNPWGLGFELRDGKDPHWTGRRNSERTFGHFGGSGTFLWVDPEPGLSCVALASREFDEWGLEHWPPFSDAILERYGR